MKTRIPSLIMITLAATLSAATADDSITEQRLAKLEARVKALEQQLQQQAAAGAAIAVAGAEVKPSVAVPSATMPAPAPAAKAKPIVILVTADGKYSISGEVMDLAGVSAKLKEFGPASPEAKPAVAIHGKESIPYGNISELLDACQAEGIWDVSLATAPK